MDVLPKGMFAIRWVVKSGTDKVRITINMRPLNAYLLTACSEVELATLHRITSLWQRDDEQCSMDMHSSYYHLELNDEASEWSGFSVADNELPVKAQQYLCGKEYACGRWRDRWVFRYRGMAMGASPSAARYCECADALIDSWRGRTVGRAVGVSPKAVRATGYIDDSLFLVQGFARGIEMGLRVALEYIICGFWINLDKTCVLPLRRTRYLGCVADSSRLRFSLPGDRCVKLRLAVDDVRAQVKASKSVSMKVLAKLIGNLWAVHVVCRRAVGIMCRSMIAILARVLRQPWLRETRDPYKLKHLLKRVWGGAAKWTREAELELRFWEKLRFEDLWAPMRHWDLLPDARDCLVRPVSGGLHVDVQIFAADSSDFASGGAQFVVVDGKLQPMPDRAMVVQLSGAALDDSSTYKELEGLCKLDFSLVPRGCRRVFFLVDNVAAMRIVLGGSKWEKLNAFAKLLFLRALHARMLLCPIWFRRNKSAIVEVDARSRLCNTADFSLPMHLFWQANGVAQRLWGRGFQFDRFASTRTVMPVDCNVRMPFNSEFWQPGSSGRNALTQDWRGCVNWVNAPFCLLDAILGLLKVQKAVAAVVVPRGTGSRWDYEAVPGCEGFCHQFCFDPRARRNRMQGQGRNSFKGLYAIVFVDFRVSGDVGFCDLRPAEELRKAHTAVRGGGEVVLSRLRRSLFNVLSQDVVTLPRCLR